MASIQVVVNFTWFNVQSSDFESNIIFFLNTCFVCEGTTRDKDNILLVRHWFVAGGFVLLLCGVTISSLDMRRNTIADDRNQLDANLILVLLIVTLELVELDQRFRKPAKGKGGAEMFRGYTV